MKTATKSFGSALLAFGAIFPAAVSSQTPVPAYKIYDFENYQLQSKLSAYGGTYTDNGETANDSVTTGNSQLTTFPFHDHLDSVHWVAGHTDSSLSAFKLGFKLGTVLLGCGENCTYPPHVGVNFPFFSDSMNLSTATHLTFWAKAEDSLKVEVNVGMREAVPEPRYSQMFGIDTTWKKYTIELKASTVFALPSWTTARPFNVAQVNAMGFSISKGNNPDTVGNALYIDDIEIVNWEYIPEPEVNVRGQAFRRSAGGLQARIAGGIAYVRIPERLAGRTGIVEALDAKGRKLGQAAFGPQVSEVGLKLPGAGTSGAGLYFRLMGE